MRKERRKIPKETKIRAELQLEIGSQCPFCSSKEVGHFHIHHIDENPSNNDISNFLLICPTCHSRITKGDITKEKVLLKKKFLTQSNSPGSSIELFTSKENFQNGLTKLISQSDSIYYTELREHWNSYSLIDDCSFLRELIDLSIKKSIEYGLLPLISDLTSNHLYYDKEAKYIYNQPHVYMHNHEAEGYNLPIYFHIRLIGILYATSIHKKIDIDTLALHKKSMNSIFSTMIKGMIENIIDSPLDKTKEYPSNYHWLIGEIFGITNNWLRSFNEKENFIKTSSYITYIPFCIQLCLSELYDAVENGKIERKFAIHQCYYGVLTEYFSPLINDILRESIENNIIAEIPINFMEDLLDFSFDEKFAMRFDEFRQGRFRVVNNKERQILIRFRNFLIEKNKI